MGSAMSSNNNDQTVDPATGLTGRQKKLVQSTWAIVKKDPIANGVAIMITWVFFFLNHFKFPAMLRAHPKIKKMMILNLQIFPKAPGVSANVQLLQGHVAGGAAVEQKISGPLFEHSHDSEQRHWLLERPWTSGGSSAGHWRETQQTGTDQAALYR